VPLHVGAADRVTGRSLSINPAVQWRLSETLHTLGCGQVPLSNFPEPHDDAGDVEDGEGEVATGILVEAREHLSERSAATLAHRSFGRCEQEECRL
jgi:hypothetical protein